MNTVKVVRGRAVALVTLALACPLSSVIGAAQDMPQNQSKPHMAQHATNHKQQEDSPEVSDLLERAKSEAAVLKVDASDMSSFTSQNASLATHANRLNKIKDDVNTVSKTITQLNNSMAMASPWQKTAIKRVNPMLMDLVQNTTAVINSMNRSKGRFLNTQDERDLVNLNADLSTELSRMVSDFVDYGKTRQHFFTLRRKLELTDEEASVPGTGSSPQAPR